MENNINSENKVPNGEQVIQKNNPHQIVSAILIVGLFIVGAILLKDTKQNTGLAEKKDSTTVEIRPVSKDEHIWGEINAEIYIVEYSDTECPFCKNFHNTMQQIIAQNEGRVAWVYRHFPIASLHPKAFHEAEATECAWEQGGNATFWKYTNEIYTRTESNNKLDTTELPKIAEFIGLDLGLFNACLASDKYAEKIENDIMDGQNAGVRGTPTSFIVKNGKVIDMIQGAEPYETLKERIENI